MSYVPDLDKKPSLINSAAAHNRGVDFVVDADDNMIVALFDGRLGPWSDGSSYSSYAYYGRRGDLDNEYTPFPLLVPDAIDNPEQILAIPFPLAFPSVVTTCVALL